MTRAVVIMLAWLAAVVIALPPIVPQACNHSHPPMYHR